MRLRNRFLKRIFNSRLLAVFDKFEWQPWWWPTESGSTFADWGLEAHESKRYHALRGTNPSRSSYPGFNGSLGARCGSHWVVSTRPSSGAFPSPSCTALYRLLSNIGPEEPFLPRVHVTDLVKFRGPGSDAKKNEGVTLDMWRISIECLQCEWAVLQPSQIVLTKQAAAWFDDPVAARLLSHLQANQQIFLRHLRSNSGAQIPFWNPQFNKIGFEARLAQWQHAFEF